MDSKTRIIEILEEYVHKRKDREIMQIYLTDHPGSLERIAEECQVDVSTVKRAINRNSFIYRYLPESDPKLHRKRRKTNRKRKERKRRRMEREKTCSHNCGNDGDKCVPFFDVQNTMMHYNWANRRMLIALVCVCISMIIVVTVFATNQTKREQMWQETIKSMYETTVTGAEHGEQDADH